MAPNMFCIVFILLYTYISMPLCFYVFMYLCNVVRSLLDLMNGRDCRLYLWLRGQFTNGEFHN